MAELVVHPHEALPTYLHHSGVACTRGPRGGEGGGAMSAEPARETLRPDESSEGNRRLGR
jgi:hypothetical protein